MACVGNWMCPVLATALRTLRTPLQEAMELFLEGCEELGTLDDVLEESGFYKVGGEWKLRKRISENKVATIH